MIHYITLKCLKFIAFLVLLAFVSLSLICRRTRRLRIRPVARFVFLFDVAARGVSLRRTAQISLIAVESSVVKRRFAVVINAGILLCLANYRANWRIYSDGRGVYGVYRRLRVCLRSLMLHPIKSTARRGRSHLSARARARLSCATRNVELNAAEFI